MMGTRRHLVLFILSVALAVGGAATRGHAQADHSHVYGAGSLSCGQWTADRAASGENFRVELSWVLGFLTAFQWSSDGAMGDTDAASIDAFVSDYCGRHPSQTISDAASALVAELKFRGTTP